MNEGKVLTRAPIPITPTFLLGLALLPMSELETVRPAQSKLAGSSDLRLSGMVKSDSWAAMALVKYYPSCVRVPSRSSPVYEQMRTSC
jgi:hypothetical protein